MKRHWRAVNLWLQSNATVLGAWSALISMVGLPLLLLGGAVTFFQVREYFRRPDVALEFASSERPLFRVVNVSSTLVRDVRYQLGLWDLDARAASTGQDPGNLQIPVATLDYIRREAAIGPWVVEDLARANTPVPDGHVIFGVAGVQCPDCVTRRDYWVYMKKRGGAWVIRNESGRSSRGRRTVLARTPSRDLLPACH